jgi:hypothetical protein
MLPSEYVSKIVIPTADEYLAATGELRRAILACVVTYHVRDYLAEAGICSRTEVDRRIKALCAFSFDLWRASATDRSTSETRSEATSNSPPATRNRFQLLLGMCRGRGGIWLDGRFRVWRLSIRAIEYLSTRVFALCSAHSAWPFPWSSRAWILRATENGCPAGLPWLALRRQARSRSRASWLVGETLRALSCPHYRLAPCPTIWRLCASSKPSSRP